MPDDRPEPCPRHELIEAFARDKLDDSQRREAERLLEQSEPCREYFRQLTAGRYPRLPNYTIIGQVGKGGFGVVYKAIHHAKERAEALKVLFSKTPLLTEYFQNEVHMIARLRHANIATLYEAQLSTPPLYYTMEFVEGERLSEYLKRGDVSLAERIGIIKSVARAVGYAHGQGVVHRDLKPQNILLDHDGQARVVDFGISIKLAEVRPPEEDDTSQKGREGPVGTIGYIAPEQEKGKTVDARADIFALGALLFHCVTGEPARLANVDDQRIRILHERKVVQPEDLSAIIAHCVEDSPDKRYTTCDDFIADLDNYLSGRMIMARENPSIPYQMFRIGALVMRDSPWTVRIAALISMAGFLTLYFWTMETRASSARTMADKTVMVGFTKGTLQAIDDGCIGADLPDLNVYDIQSWRMLYGRLLEKLAVASPRMILIDSYMAQCSEYDQYIIDGMNALDANAPVIIGALKFDLNGEPELCAEILDAADGYGTIIGGDPLKHANQLEVTYCIQRGKQPPIPGLALAAFAAWKHPDCDLKLQLDANKRELLLQYRKRNPLPGESYWHEDTDRFPLYDVKTVKRSGSKIFKMLDPGTLQDGDKLGNALIGARPNSYWNGGDRTLAFEDVLVETDPEQLKTWFDDRVIVIAQMRPGFDQYTKKDGAIMFGCRVHAEAIDELLASIHYHRFSRWELAYRNLSWCAVAVVLVSLLGRRNWQSVRIATLVCISLVVLGILLGGHAALTRSSEKIWVEFLMAGTGLLASGSLVFWAKAVGERQMSLTPSSATMVTEGPTLASTILAETR